jgi:hypothetical protein
MKMKSSIFCIAIFTFILASCGGSGKKSGDGITADKNESKSTWTEERKNKDIADCITSMMFKKENDALPEATKKAVCECSISTKMARYPDAEKANINMAAELGIDKIMSFRDSCIAEIVK